MRQMDLQLYEKLIRELIKKASEKGRISYTDAGKPIGLNMRKPADRNDISLLLDGISKREHKEGRPLLSAVVIHGAWKGSDHMPGKGFFKGAKELGLFKEDLDNKEDKTKFWKEKLKEVHEFWANKENQDHTLS